MQNLAISLYAYSMNISAATMLSTVPIALPAHISNNSFKFRAPVRRIAYHISINIAKLTAILTGSDMNVASPREYTFSESSRKTLHAVIATAAMLALSCMPILPSFSLICRPPPYSAHPYAGSRYLSARAVSLAALNLPLANAAQGTARRMT